MDFDPLAILVPFRMQPGLRRLESGRHLTPLTPGSELWQQKKAVLDSGRSQHAVAGFDAQPVREALFARAAAEGLAVQGPIELAFEEDFALLDGPSTTLPWLCVCVPSHWAPEDKLGLPFTAVHAPVADGQVLLAAARQLTQLVTGGDAWERSVWTVSPSDRYDQHPRRHARAPWPDTEDPETFARQCFLRAERQTFLPYRPGQAIFTIRVMLQPLAAAVGRPAQAARLHEAIATMSDGVLAYKGLAPARARLLAWLARRGA